MITPSTLLAKAISERPPSGRFDRKRTKIFVFGKKKNRYYYGNREEYRSEYLKSSHWKQLRQEKIEKNPLCEKCGVDSNLDVHHLLYKNLYDISLDDLQTLCRKCHDEEHKKIIKEEKKKFYKKQRNKKKRLEKKRSKIPVGGRISKSLKIF